MGINNPVPRSLRSECRKAAKILASFVKPNQIFGQDMVIPPHVLQNAEGLVILTVLKAGFLFSGRAGSGVIVSRLPDGGWSAPSALVTAGAGVGGQIGAELTDFVFILNSRKAVDSFSQTGNITLGGNMSLAAGPLGRNAEAAGSASATNVATIFAYSKTKGLFAGVSLEGSVLVERREANRKFYGNNNATAKKILSGYVEPPPDCDAIFRVLESRAFRNPNDFADDDSYFRHDGDSFYDDIPSQFSDGSSVRRGGESDDDYGGGRGGGAARFSSRNRDEDDRRGGSRRDSAYSYRGGREEDREVGSLTDRFRKTHFKSSYSDEPAGRGGSSRANNDDRYDRDRDWRDKGSSRGDRGDRGDRGGMHSSRSRGDYENGSSRSNRDREYDRDERYDRDDRDRDRGDRHDRYDRDEKVDRYERQKSPREKPFKPAPPPPHAPVAAAAEEKAVALYTFDGEQPGDLSFRKGDVIAVVKRGVSKDDWWTGRNGAIEGIFPANYVELM